MKIKTERFEEVEIDEKKIITLFGGIIGFENYHRFVILDFLENSPFRWLQSVKEPSLAFVICDPWNFFKDYELETTRDCRQELEIESDDDIMVLSIATVPQKITGTTVNLLSPIIVNQKKMIGKQIILYNSGYKPRHKIFREIKLKVKETETKKLNKVKAD